MNIQELAKRQGNKPMRKQDFKRAFDTIKEIRALLDGRVTNSRNKYKRELLEIELDKRSPASKLSAMKDNAEFSVLVEHEIAGSIENALDKVESHWQKLKEKHIKE
ncbi:hypothetical protein VB285_004452 [Salmonella enterica]|nr:hypothetical protein [Salmonella enterica]ELU3766303.1 hypothetical protein [Salmonella enterica]EMC1963994.1 hypothetical protein [Salmonella enterica]